MPEYEDEPPEQECGLDYLVITVWLAIFGGIIGFWWAVYNLLTGAW